jgi:predicted nucleotidyltransferase
MQLVPCTPTPPHWIAVSLSEELSSLLPRFGLVALYVFGSRAAEIAARVRGESPAAEQAESDVDVGAQPESGRRLTAAEKVELALALEDLLGANRVDLVVTAEAPAFLALDVVCGELIACTDLDAQAEYELFVLRRAGDLAPFEYERRELVLKEGAR